MYRLACLALLLGLSALVLGRTADGSTICTPRVAEAHAEEIRVDEETTRPLALMRVSGEASWQDLAYLATVPAMSVAGNGSPAVLALPADGDLAPEFLDYIERYDPTTVYWIGAGDIPRLASESPLASAYNVTNIDAQDAESLSLDLATRFWDRSDTVVICGATAYGDACLASSLAALCDAPLIVLGENTDATQLADIARELRVRRTLIVGDVDVPQEARQRGEEELEDANECFAWIAEERIDCDYVAVVNPYDREHTTTRKLSLAGPLLAAARRGLVVPLFFETQWKVGFAATACDPIPAGIPDGGEPPRSGEVSINGATIPFVLTMRERNGQQARLYIDRNGNGTFAEEGEEPLRMADLVTLGDRDYVLTMHHSNGPGPNDVFVTWPRAETLQTALVDHYDSLGHAPEHLCIVGFPDALPQGIVTNEGGMPVDLVSDQIYANLDDDLFTEIGVGRVIAENYSLATLYASRVSTYNHLLDESWATRAGEARWENTLSCVFENVGFEPSIRHAGPQEIQPDSPLTSVAILSHSDHSSWRGLGGTFSWDSNTLLAPCLVESSGCSTAALDRETNNHSVVARLLRNGAVGFHGNGRNGIAHQNSQRFAFLNAVVAGMTVGQAHREAQNTIALRVLETNQRVGGPDRYQLYSRGYFGDPALTIALPSRPITEPASIEVRGNRVRVNAPEEWTTVTIEVPADWSRWSTGDLSVLRAPGVYSLSSWCGEGYDRETPSINARLRTSRHIREIRQVHELDAPLGWGGTFAVDDHSDGTRTYYWRVQLADFDQTAGDIRSSVERLDFRISWQ